MNRFRRLLILVLCGLMASTKPAISQTDSILPQGVAAVWDLTRAYHETTPTRERICLNGLWRWQPAQSGAENVPNTNWGYFKVPGCWPGITDYMQKDCQNVYPHPTWKNDQMGSLTTAWYQREFTVPDQWQGRRISISMDCLNSFASIWVDGQKAGELRFPSGELDLTALCHPGAKHVLSVQVIAMPLQAVMVSYGDTFGARQIKGAVERRGLCGDVYLLGAPTGARLDNVKISTSVRKWEVTFGAALRDLVADDQYTLRAQITDHGQAVETFTSKPFKSSDVQAGKITFTESWKPRKLWDTHTTGNMFDASVSLLDGKGQVIDTALPERFGFREFWIDGRDFYLNGSRIYLCAVPFDNASVGAAWATYDGARESMQRLKSFGINFVYTHNYGCEPGTHLSFAEILKAADDEGMLVSFSQPHFGQYDWKSPDADRTNGYARHAEAYVQMAGSHPSVVFYSMSHNATGTEEEMNPDLIDGLQDVRNQWAANNVKKALRAEAIVQKLDPSRIVYHHSSGNLSSMHTANFYANFTPIQEMSDWLEHWATKGAKPLFLCEYGVPISWDWMMYRGWYQGTRTFGSARVPWELCIAEWDSQFFGDQAFKVTDLEKEALRWEARQVRAGKLWNRWDYPRNAVESTDVEQRNAVFAMYLADNIRAFRTWGISAFCPWDHGIYWKLRNGTGSPRKAVKTDWDNLQRPGFSPDYVESQMEWLNLSHDRADWIPTVAAQALYQNNLPVLAYIGGKASAFTSKDHNFLPGDAVEKQIIVINNSRKTVTAKSSWSLNLPEPVLGQNEATVETGQQARMPFVCPLPDQTTPGQYQLTATIKFSDGQTQTDTFTIDVLPRPPKPAIVAKIALFDPQGQTAKLLGALGVQYTTIDSNADLSAADILIVGKGALTCDGGTPDITRVRDGLKVILFEQTSEVLEKRFGFRVEEYGLRSVFKRLHDHPLLTGITDANLWNWSGEATLLPPRLKYQIAERHAPEVKWCDIPVTRAWRAGNRGNVASVIIEKPARGNFMPILDGGFSLQFTPLMEYREGRGMMLFCQIDITGRTENDPTASTLARNIVQYAADWKPSPTRKAVYAGGPAGKRHLEHAGFTLEPYTSAKLSTGDVLVVTPEAGKELTADQATITEFVNSGGCVLAIGLDADEANAFLPFKVTTKPAEHIATFFESFDKTAFLAGINPADVHNRDPRVIPLVSGGANPIGDGVLALSSTNVVFCQLTPWWMGDGKQVFRRTYRRTSYLATRLLSNLGAPSATPLLERFHTPAAKSESRWLEGLYVDTPEEWDDPYRFFCW